MSNPAGLTPKQRLRLNLLKMAVDGVEDAAAAVRVHGYGDSCTSPRPDSTAREVLERALGDLRHAMIALCAAGDVSKAAIHERADAMALIDASDQTCQ
jgi:hypothetical protein